MKKKSKAIIIFVIILTIIISAIVGMELITKNISIAYYKSKLDKNYEDLSDFKLEAPFDTDVLDTYDIISLSTEDHIAIDFFGKPGVSTIPFLAMIDGVVTEINPHIMENQNGTDNWAYEIWISINSEYAIMLNFETFGYGDDVKARQKDNLFIKVGDLVKTGDLIGNLIICQESAHVHFSLKKEHVADSESFIVPEPYFSETGMSLINDVFQRRI